MRSREHAPEYKMPDALYDVWSELNKANDLSSSNSTIEDFTSVNEVEQRRDKKELREKEDTIHNEHSELAAFFESALPTVDEYGWFGDEVEFVQFNTRGEVAKYNDYCIGTDHLLELPNPDPNPEKKSAVLRIDVTKESYLERLETKIKGKTEQDLEKGAFSGVYFETHFKNTGRQDKEKIDTAPRVVMHLNAEQIIEFGQKLADDKTKKVDSSLKALKESSLQLTLIDQARHQLEDQAIRALTMFTEEIDRQGNMHRSSPQQVEEIQHLFRGLSAATKAKDSSQAQQLVEEFMSAEHLYNLPRVDKTKYLLEGISPWLNHFTQLEEKKMGSLPQSVIKKAQAEAESSTPHQMLVEFPH